MTTRTFTAVLHKEEDLYVAECPEVGTVSQGYTIEEAIANLKRMFHRFTIEICGRKPAWTTVSCVVEAASS